MPARKFRSAFPPVGWDTRKANPPIISLSAPTAPCMRKSVPENRATRNLWPWAELGNSRRIVLEIRVLFCQSPAAAATEDGEVLEFPRGFFAHSVWSGKVIIVGSVKSLKDGCSSTYNWASPFTGFFFGHAINGSSSADQRMI